jgi:hypothetical protein
MKRVSERGERKFVGFYWKKAVDTIVTQWKRVIGF